MRRILSITAVALVLFPTQLRADAEIILRDGTKFKATITEESTQGIKVSSKKELIRAADIQDVFHEVTPTGTQVSMNRPAHNAEKDFNDPAKEAMRSKNLKDAITKYRETLKNLSPPQPLAERQIQYKIAYLTAQQVRLGEAKVEYALLDLRDFKTKHPNSWQLTECLKTLAELQIQMKNYTDAEQSYKELASADVEPASKQEAEFLSAQISIRIGNHAEAQKRLQALVSKLPKTSPVLGKAQIAIAESMLASRQTDQARQMLRGFIKGTQDPELKARAYNTIGKSYFDANQLKEARWEFLWVELMYNENRDEHARALYHLWQIFTTLGEIDRAIECRDLLLNGRNFQGTEYYRIGKEKAG